MANGEDSGGGGRTVAAVLISAAGLIGLLIALAGLALIAVHAFARDGDGFYTSDTERLMTDGYAIASDELDLGRDAAGIDFEEVAATLRFDAESAGPESLFLGIGPSHNVERYLAGVDHSNLTDFRDGEPVYTEVTGDAPGARPSAQPFWVIESEGAGVRRVDWEVENGNWSAVVMNADASRGLAVDAEAGAKMTWLIWVGVGLATVGLAITLGAGFGLARVLRRRPTP